MSDDLTSAYLLGAYEGYKAWKDAVEFEARVAAMLADRDFADSGTTCELCPFHGEDNCSEAYKAKYHNKCISGWARMKEARLAVEEELDG